MMGGGGGGGMLSGLGGMVMQGMAMGTGSAIAHRAVDSVMGPRQVEHVHTGQEAPAPAAGAAPHAMSGMLPRPRAQPRTHPERSQRCWGFLLLHAGAAGLQLLGGALGNLLPFAKRRKGVSRCPVMGAGGFRTVPNQRVGPGAAGGSCVNETEMFQQCVRNTGGDVSACQAYLDMLTNCKRSACPTQSRTSRSSTGIFMLVYPRPGLFFVASRASTDRDAHVCSGCLKDAVVG